MTNRDRLLAILDHKLPDRIPWIPRLLLWYRAHVLNQSLPRKWEGYSLRDIEKDLGLGTPARDGSIFAAQYDSVDIIKREEDGRHITEYHTPRGSVQSIERTSETLKRLGLSGRIEEHLLKSPSDYRVWEYVVEHTNWIPNYDSFITYDQKIGDDGLPLVSVGDVPFHEFMQHLAGYESGFLQLADFTQEVEHLLAVMYEVQSQRLWPVIVNAPARLLLHGKHLSSQFTPPPMFEKYILPYYREFTILAHENGKSVAMHADNDTSQILDLIETSGWDMVECFVTAPMVPLTLSEARKYWGDRVIIWGGASLPSSSHQVFLSRTSGIIWSVYLILSVHGMHSFLGSPTMSCLTPK